MKMEEIQLKCLLEGHKDAVYALAEGLDAHSFFSAGGDGMVVLWDITTGDGTMMAKLPATVYSLLHLKEKQLLYAGLRNGEVYEINLPEKRQSAQVKLKGGVFALNYFGGHIVAGTMGGELYSLGDFPEISIDMAISKRSCRSMAVEPSQGWLATGWSDHSIRIYDKALNEITHLEGNTNSVFAVEFSPDGKRLYGGGRDAQLRVWDTENNFELLETLPAHWYTINNIVAVRNTLFTASRDKTIRIWETYPPELIGTLNRPEFPMHSHSINKLLWINEGNLLVSAGDDRVIRVWSIPQV